MEIRWVNGFEIKVTADSGEIVISANREGLLSLARQMIDLSEEPAGSHIHYNDGNSLEEGSVELVIVKAE